MEALRNLGGALAERAMATVNQRVTGLTDRLTDYAAGGDGAGAAAIAKGVERLKAGDSPVKAVMGAGVEGGKQELKQAFGGGGGGGEKSLKVTNIVEVVDVGVPVTLAYNTWTEFTNFPSYMKKVEDVEQEEDEKLKWKAQVLWSHRRWESTIHEQVPDERIVWTSKGDKGSVDGTVSFHELAPDLTRILLVLEYHPQGFMEHTGNLWRAQGRRVRLELKHYVRHVMREVILDPDQVKGWRGEIRDGEVVQEDEGGEGGEQPEQGKGDEQPEKAKGGEPEQDKGGEEAPGESGEEKPSAKEQGKPEGEGDDRQEGEDRQPQAEGSSQPSGDEGEGEQREKEPPKKAAAEAAGSGSQS